MTLAPMATRQRRGSRQLTAVPAYPWDPYREMQEINSRFDQLIQAVFGDVARPAGTAGQSAMALPVDIEETDDAYLIEVDLPNVNPQDISMEMRGEELRISGERQQRERTGMVHRQNRPEGGFSVLVDLPSDIDPDRVEATYDQGVLTVQVGKTQDIQPRRIEVQTRQGQAQSGKGGGQQQSGERRGQAA